MAERRSDKDYAIEHATYMAEAAKRYLEAINAEHLAQMEYEEEESAAAEGAMDAAMDATSEAYRTLQSRIYEFEKRRDRAIAPSPAPTEKKE